MADDVVFRGTRAFLLSEDGAEEIPLADIPQEDRANYPDLFVPSERKTGHLNINQEFLRALRREREEEEQQQVQEEEQGRRQGGAKTTKKTRTTPQTPEKEKRGRAKPGSERGKQKRPSVLEAVTQATKQAEERLRRQQRECAERERQADLTLAATAARVEALEAEEKRKAEQVKELEKQLADSLERLKGSGAQGAAVAKDIEALTEQLRVANAKVSTCAAQIEQVQAEQTRLVLQKTADLEESKRANEAELARVLAELRAQAQQVAFTTPAGPEVAAQLTALTSQLLQEQKKLGTCHAQIKALQVSAQTAVGVQLTALEEKIKDSELQREQALQRVRATESELVTALDKLAGCGKENEHKASELNALTSQLVQSQEGLNQCTTKLNQQLALYADYEQKVGLLRQCTADQNECQRQVERFKTRVAGYHKLAQRALFFVSNTLELTAEQRAVLQTQLASFAAEVAALERTS